MKKIKICALHPYTTTEAGIRKLLDFDERNHGLEFVWDEKNPDYVIATQIIYYEKQWYKKFIKYMNTGCISIFFAGECISPDLNLFDYAIAFDRNLSCGDRVGRMPTLRFYRVSVFDEYKRNMPFTVAESGEKKKFCNFMYSNGKGNPSRDALFYKISEYKRVDSIGSHLNNTGAVSTRNNTDWRRLSIECRQEYKFSIAAENACFPGYTSEKLLSCLEAHTVPIYWGDPSVGQEFNSKAFVNCHEYSSFDDVLHVIEKIDQSPELFTQMLNEPWQTPEQVEKTMQANEAYDVFVKNIFSQKKEDAHRVYPGYHPEWYKKWFIQRYKMPLGLWLKNIIRQTGRKLVKKKVDIV